MPEMPGAVRDLPLLTLRCMSPLTLTPKTNGPGRFEASGTIDLAKVVASGSSGGANFPLAALPLPLRFAA